MAPEKEESAVDQAVKGTESQRTGRRGHLGIVATLVLGLLIAAPEARATSLVEGDFEGLAPGAGSLSSGPPPIVGIWSGDQSSIVAAENGITPGSGSQMLSFIGTATTGPSNTGAAQMFQLVDTTGRAAGTILQASMLVNRVAGNALTDDRFTIQILAYSGVPGQFSTLFQRSELGMSTGGNFFSDADPATWELVETDPFALPSGTTFVAIHAFATENISQSSTFPEFDGHYMDRVRLVPEPSVSLLALAGLLMLGAIRKHFRPRVAL